MSNLHHELDAIEEEVLEENFIKGIIDELKTLPGVGEATAEKIYEGGFYSIMDVAVSSVGSFMESTNISESTAIKIISGARGMVELGNSRTALEMLEDEKDMKRDRKSTRLNSSH